MVAGKKKHPTIRETRPEIIDVLVDKSQGDLTTGSQKKIKMFCQGQGCFEIIERKVYHQVRCDPLKLILCDICRFRPTIRNSGLAIFYELVYPERDGGLTIGSDKSLEWFCSEHDGFVFTWEAPVYSRTGKKPQGCPVCANIKIIAGYNDLATTHPYVAAQAVDQSWVTKYCSGSRAKAEWFCDKHGERFTWWAMPTDRTSKGAGCPQCAKFGFDPSQPAILYIWSYDDGSYPMIKKGITNKLDTKARGFENIPGVVIEYQGLFTMGSDAYTAETDLHEEVLNSGAQLVDRKKYEVVIGTTLGGWTETFEDPDGSVLELMLAVVTACDTCH